MADAQSRVQGLIDDLVGRDIERGLQVAAYHAGKLVVDAWSGLADAETRRPVDGDTLLCTSPFHRTSRRRPRSSIGLTCGGPASRARLGS